MSFTTNDQQGTWHVSGGVIPSTTLTAIDPQSGQPDSMTIATDRRAGDDLTGALSRQVDVAACNTGGQTQASLSGFLGFTYV